MKEFPQLNQFLNQHFNLTNGHKCEIYQISSDGSLHQNHDDYMFLSYDTFDYRSNNQESMFYEDKQRSNRDLSDQHTYAKSEKKPSRTTYSSFEEYAFTAMRYIENIIVSKNKAKCWQFLKIIYDQECSIQPRIAAICLNRMFSKKFTTSMLRYNNDKRTKAVLQKIRKKFSLL